MRTKTAQVKNGAAPVKNGVSKSATALALKPAPKPTPKPTKKPAAKAAAKPLLKAVAKPAPAAKSKPKKLPQASDTPISPTGKKHSTYAVFEQAHKFLAVQKPVIYVNGMMMPKAGAMISVYDHGLLYGDGVFEGIRVYNGKIFKCGQHMERLWRCAEMIRLQIPVSREEMVQIMRDCIEANNLTNGYIRLVVSRGVGNLGLDPRKCPVAGVICIADQIALYSDEQYKNGMKIIVAQRPRTPIECLDPRIKSLNYLNNILGKVEAIDQGCDEAIMLNLNGFVGECTGDNLFIVRDGKVYTPPTEAGLLEGITRRLVMDLCADLHIPLSLRAMRPEEVKSADEVFLTGTAAEIIAVTQIDDIKIGQGTEGPVTNRLRKTFRSLVTSNDIPED